MPLPNAIHTPHPHSPQHNCVRFLSGSRNSIRSPRERWILLSGFLFLPQYDLGVLVSLPSTRERGKGRVSCRVPPMRSSLHSIRVIFIPHSQPFSPFPKKLRSPPVVGLLGTPRRTHSIERALCAFVFSANYSTMPLQRGRVRRTPTSSSFSRFLSFPAAIPPLPSPTHSCPPPPPHLTFSSTSLTLPANNTATATTNNKQRKKRTLLRSI